MTVTACTHNSAHDAACQAEPQSSRALMAVLASAAAAVDRTLACQSEKLNLRIPKNLKSMNQSQES